MCSFLPVTAIPQVQTYRFSGHSPADPEHERGRKQEKRWARATQDPLAIFESEAMDAGITKVEKASCMRVCNSQCRCTGSSFCEEGRRGPCSCSQCLFRGAGRPRVCKISQVLPKLFVWTELVIFREK